MTTLKVLLSTCLLAAAAAPMAWAQQGAGYTGPHPMWGGGGWMFMGPLTMILFLAAIIAVVVFIIRRAGGASSGRPPQEPGQPLETALDILNKRYARGEIDTAEFEEKRRAITE
jgi:putative membrane protein